MKVFITGAAGVFGSHLSEYLINRNYSVVGLDDMSTGNVHNIASVVQKDNYVLNIASILDYNLVKKYMAGCDAVVHLAAKTSVPLSFKQEEDVFHTNVYGTHVVFDCAKELNIPKFVLASSTAVYGKAPTPMLEDSICYPVSPYAVSKLAAEYIVLKSQIENVCILRFNDLFGPRQELMGEAKPVVIRFIENAVANRRFKIHGDGLQKRMFTHIFNACEAVHLALQTNCDQRLPIFNIGGSKPTTLMQLYTLLCDMFNTRFGVDFTESYRKGDVKSIFAPFTKAEEMLNYKPIITLEEGVKQTVEYLQLKGGLL